MKKKILASVEESIRAIQVLKEQESIDFIANTSEALAQCFSQGGKLLIAGNGGSLCDGLHFAEEFTAIFRKKRKALPAIALSDPAHISCIANDLGYEFVFQRGVEAYGKEKDVLICLSTSGNSINLINAIEQAKKMKLKTISFLGKTGGAMKGMSDLEWQIKGFATSDKIQEAQMAAMHIIVEMVEEQLFYQKHKLLKNLTLASH
jgi:D-sedoheptulose 7-phosphate isomerase